MKKIVILGSTGSIGKNAVDVIATHPDELQAVALAANKNARTVLEQAKLLGVKTVAVADEVAASSIAGECRDSGITLLSGARALEEAACTEGADTILVSTVGLSGLKPVVAAIEAGCDVALATKEVLVAAGELVTGFAAKNGVRLLPVDSEHSAIFQCMQGSGEVESITLTASGGPFLDTPENLSSVTPQMALKHPRWDMGRKVTIDSATMMNKGFEIIEAKWLFDLPLEKIKTVVHPQSIIHSLVTFTDGSTLAQLAPPDMRIPIQYALSWPQRFPAKRAELDLAGLGKFEFRLPDEKRFPCLALVRQAAAAGGTVLAALSAADEIAVNAFLSERIPFTGIPDIVKEVVENAPDIKCDSFEAVAEADAAARIKTKELICTKFC